MTPPPTVSRCTILPDADLEAFRDPDCWTFMLSRADGSGLIVKTYEGPIFEHLEGMLTGLKRFPL